MPARRERLLSVSLALAATSALVAAAARCGGDGYDPLAAAAARAALPGNPEASIPPVCYAATAGGANGCWTCHTTGFGPNTLADFDLQRTYSFSDAARKNPWTNLLEDLSAAAARTSDAEILEYIREDNYAPLRKALRALSERRDYPGYVPDLDLGAGFDEEGFARDGSGFRAVRYKPFPGSFWPTNGGAGDVFLRLPAVFREDTSGAPSREVYKLNLALLEAAIASPSALPREGEAAPAAAPAAGREVEPVSELLAGVDLDGDGALEPAVTRVVRLPARYAGGAAGVPVRPWIYPRGAELLHSVRYLDPDHPALLAARMKELRYARKVDEPDDWAIARAYEREAEEKEEGRPPFHAGGPEVGLRNAFGWQIQAFIEDEQGRLRLQTAEEHRACMGCHGAVGVTVDHTFSLARKVPGAAGWRHQDLRGMPDVPQAGHAEPEVLTYLRRAGGGDDYRANTEMLARFFPGGALDEAAVRRAAPGGDRDLVYLVAPSRERALLLDKAYRALVRAQRFEAGREVVLGPAPGILRAVEGESTGLGEAERVYLDGRLHLAW
ncbi:hypothetical protein SOCE26_012690 [Sorangium cellulosum]|uniref:Cytochrome c domain-containing protein n=1 Tax=Sorangium cellulosum TaxID=56 RepID=A0A2L0EKQ8_SORCE|nr:hypothetical protein [Sorangium cellulosum]AUX39874.1 hypothetical protein SOCE26_012690 [Sorangium cellulosum]